ncbi:putative carveol dehydrogenase [Mycobacteroides abscessus subsp. abscessus]|nr:putative carveol dehydrogenase [Mycobacteroides abscessus subsp. abscessus]
MDAVVQRFGGIDVVVANAGIAGPIATVAHVSAERWQQVIDVNLVGVFHTVRLALPHVQPRRGYMMVVHWGWCGYCVLRLD